MHKYIVINNLLTNRIKRSLLLALVSFSPIILLNTPLANSQTPANTDQNSSLAEPLQIINSTLATYPAQNNTRYVESSRISINSKGKLMLYKQYEVPASCTASREEAFLTDLEPTKISSFSKGSTMVITVGCKDGVGDCVQRFFRNSCDVTFKPQSFQKELLIISSANLRNTEQIRNAFSQLIKLASNTSESKSLENLNNKENSLTLDKTSSLEPAPKKRSLSLTMDDVAPMQKAEKKKTKPAAKTTPNQNPNTELQPEEEPDDLGLDELLDLLKDK